MEQNNYEIHEANKIYGRDGYYGKMTRSDILYDKDIKLMDRIEHFGLAHQKKFYFWILQGSELYTDKMVELLQNDFTIGKNHVKVTSVSRFDNQIHVTFEKKLCYRFGIHTLGTLVVELMRKRDLDKRQLEENAKKWNK